MGKNVEGKAAQLVRVILVLLNIRPSEIAKELNISTGFMSHVISGERKYPEFNKWLADQIISYLE